MEENPPFLLNSNKSIFDIFDRYTLCNCGIFITIL